MPRVLEQPGLLVADVELETFDLGIDAVGRRLGRRSALLLAELNEGLGVAVGQLHGDARVVRTVRDVDQLSASHLADRHAAPHPGGQAAGGDVVEGGGHLTVGDEARLVDRVLEGRVLPESQMLDDSLGQSATLEDLVLGGVELGAPPALEPESLRAERVRRAPLDLDAGARLERLRGVEVVEQPRADADEREDADQLPSSSEDLEGVTQVKVTGAGAEQARWLLIGGLGHGWYRVALGEKWWAVAVVPADERLVALKKTAPGELEKRLFDVDHVAALQFDVGLAA